MTLIEIDSKHIHLIHTLLITIYFVNFFIVPYFFTVKMLVLNLNLINFINKLEIYLN